MGMINPHIQAEQVDTVMLRQFVLPFLVLPVSAWAISVNDQQQQQLEEVVVTATRFSQRAGDLPIGVSIVSAQ